MSITPSEKTKLKAYVRRNKHTKLIDAWFEHKDMGINLCQMIDEPGIFDGLETRKSARKRLRSAAEKRYRTIQALRGKALRTDEKAPWIQYPNLDPRPIQGVSQHGDSFRVAARIQLSQWMSKSYDKLILEQLTKPTQTRVAISKNSKP